MELNTATWPGNVGCVALRGRLDAEGADRIGTRFTAATVAQARPTAVDLSGVTFMGSMGIRLLISAAKGLRTKGARLVLFGPQPLVRELLEESAIDQIIDVAVDEEDALALLANPR